MLLVLDWPVPQGHMVMSCFTVLGQSPVDSIGKRVEQPKMDSDGIDEP